MRWMVFALTVSAMAAVGACTKPNPDVCCSGPADCAAHGIPEDRTCSADLVCLNHSCEVPQCTESSQCDASAPICELSTYSCRGCIDDDECESGVCNDDGMCALEPEIIYLSTTGTDNDECTRQAPCRTVAHALTNADAVRFKLVFEPGAYTLDLPVSIPTPVKPTAVRAHFHGHRARLVGEGEAGVAWITAQVPMLFREIELVGEATETLVSTSAEIVLDRVTMIGGVGLRTHSFTPHVRINRTAISATSRALMLEGSPEVSITNLLAYGSSELVVDLGSGAGTASFVTIATGASQASAGATGIACSPSITLRSSIVWTPGSPLPPVEGCTLDNVIAGPVVVLGARATDPEFANLALGDFHLMSSSPARDAADDGPALDFEGDPRPQGERWDLGADEALQP